MSTLMTERETYHHGDLAAALRGAALAAVRRDGAHRFSLRAVARDVGVDVAAAYRHYRNKTDLLGAVANGGFAALAERMRRQLEGIVDPSDRMAAVGRAYVLFALDEPELVRLMFGPLRPRGQAPPPDERNPYMVLLGVLDELAAAGRCTLPVDVAADVAWSAVHGLAALAIDGRLEREAAVARIEPTLAVVLRGLAPPR
ncbi:MAG: TetR/AcrR family transcriptional regulator [Myxococcales bacterium]|nr:TetR/AcrR family transcriptional regulator [Myxococcales bacterium]